MTFTVATLNLASGRGVDGAPLDGPHLRDALAPLADPAVDVLCLQEVDVGQSRSHRVHQALAAAEATGLPHWRFVPTLQGTPGPWRTWTRTDPVLMAETTVVRPLFGNVLLTRHPVRRWHVLGLGGSRARLPVQGPDSRRGGQRWWWVPDEPRVAIAAELDDLTVVGTHLSFWPPAACRQLLRLRVGIAALPAPVVVAGDLNLPGPLPAAMLGGDRLLRHATYPASGPRLQLDHIVDLGRLSATSAGVKRLDVGDHLTAWATLRI